MKKYFKYLLNFFTPNLHKFKWLLGPNLTILVHTWGPKEGSQITNFLPFFVIRASLTKCFVSKHIQRCTWCKNAANQLYLPTSTALKIAPGSQIIKTPSLALIFPWADTDSWLCVCMLFQGVLKCVVDVNCRSKILPATIGCLSGNGT